MDAEKNGPQKKKICSQRTSEVKVVIAKMTAYLIDNHTKLSNVLLLDQKIQMKRAKRPRLTFLHTYIHTEYPGHRISYKLIKSESHKKFVVKFKMSGLKD